MTVPAAARPGDGGASVGEFLKLGTGGRAPAMGDAWTAGAEGVGALHYNPALLGGLERGEIEGMYQSSVLDIGRGTLGAVRPIGRTAGWGVSINYLDYGATPRTLVSAAGGATIATNSGTFSGRDLAAGISVGRRWNQIYAGATAKVVSLSYDNASATAVAVDLGFAWRDPALPISAGLTIRNIGTSLRFDRSTERLPLALRVGLTWTPLADGRTRIHLDLEESRHEEPSLLAGVEHWIGGQFALRVGYDGRRSAGEGLTAGLGFRRGDFSIDYAFAPFGRIGDEHRVALGYRFGAVRR